MKRHLIIGAVVLALLTPGLLMAQGELSLDGLAYQVESLNSKVAEIFTTQDDLSQRLAAVETAIAPTPTATPSPTVTATATHIATAVASPTPLPDEPFVTLQRRMNVQRGPGTHHDILGTAEAGAVFDITGKNLNGDWWQIDYDGQAAWVYAPYVTAIDADGVQVVPTPTPLPTATAKPTNTPLPAATPAPEPTPTATLTAEQDQNLIRLGHMLAINDYLAHGEIFARLDDSTEERIIAIYRYFFLETAEKCGMSPNELFWTLDEKATRLDNAGVSIRIGENICMFFLEWFVANEIADPCESIIEESTKQMIAQYS